jgi:hypothetical protein
LTGAGGECRKIVHGHHKNFLHVHIKFLAKPSAKNGTQSQGNDSKRVQDIMWLVSPAQRALEKIVLWPKFSWKTAIRPMPQMGDFFSGFKTI